MKLRRLGAGVAASAIVLAAAPVAVAEMETDVRRFPLKRAGAVALTLSETRPVTRFEIAAPHRWTDAGLDMILAWSASQTIPSGTGLVVELNDEPAGAADVKSGAGKLSIAASNLSLTGHRLMVEIRVIFGTPAQDRSAGEAIAFVRLDGASPVTLSGRVGPPAVLSGLPGMLVERAGDVVPPLVVALPASPSAEAIEAAGVVASAVAIHTGFPGTPLRVVSGDDEATLAKIPGALVRIREETFAASVAVRRRKTGETELVLEGLGRRLVDAAWGVAIPGSLGGDVQANAPIGVGRPPLPPSGRRLHLGSKRSDGPGPLRIEIGFRLPTDRVVESAKLRLQLGFDVAGGGRASIRANGRPVGAAPLPSTGSGRMSLAFDLKRGDVDPGDNMIEVVVTTNRPPGAVVEVLDGSFVEVRTRARVQPALDYFPFLAANDPAWRNTIVSLPGAPTPDEIGAVLQMLAEAARWMGRPLEAAIVLGADAAATLRTRNVVALVREPADITVPGLPVMRPGTVVVTRRGTRTLLAAVGPQALSPFAAGYYAGRARGSAIVVDDRGDVRTLAASPREPGAGHRWWLPLGVIVAIVAAGFTVGLRRGHRRVAVVAEDVPWTGGRIPPTLDPRPVKPAVLDRDAALEDWLSSRFKIEENALWTSESSSAQPPRVNIVTRES